MPSNAQTLVRLERHIVRSSDPDGCWTWTGSLCKGYGSTFAGSLLEGTHRSWRAHRLIYTLLVGPIPEGKFLDHTCHNNDESCPGGVTCPHRACVNPAHLIPCTNRENIMRGKTFAARKAAQTHCVNGHEFTERNIYRDPTTGTRRCLTCRQQRDRMPGRGKKIPCPRCGRPMTVYARRSCRLCFEGRG